MNAKLFLVLFLVYIALMILIGYLASKKQDTGDDFLMGGRKVPLFLLLGTTVATMVGTGSSMGAVGYGYKNGWAASLYGIGGGIGMILLAMLFSNARSKKFSTMGEEIASYYGGNKILKSVVAILIYVASVGWLGAHILGGSMYLSWIAQIDLLTAKIITVLGFGLYVVIGGYMAVVYTDVIQALILFIGFILMAIFAIPAAGGWENMMSKIPEGANSMFGTGQIGIMPAISLAAVIGIGVLATPSYRHRIYTGKDEKTVKKGLIITAVLYMFFSVIPGIVGMAAFTLDAGLEQANHAFPFMATKVLPAGMGMLVLIAGLSATMSSGDSDAIAGVTTLVTDVYEIFKGKSMTANEIKKNSRLALVLTLGIAFLFTVTATNILGYISTMVSTIMSGLAACGVIGKLWKRATWQGGLSSIIGGSVISFYVTSNSELLEILGNPVLPAFFGACLICVLVSLLTPVQITEESEELESTN